MTSKSVLEVIDKIQNQGASFFFPIPFKGYKSCDFVSSNKPRPPYWRFLIPDVQHEQIQFLKTLNKSLIGNTNAHFN